MTNRLAKLSIHAFTGMDGYLTSKGARYIIQHGTVNFHKYDIWVPNADDDKIIRLPVLNTAPSEKCNL